MASTRMAVEASSSSSSPSPFSSLPAQAGAAAEEAAARLRSKPGLSFGLLDQKTLNAYVHSYLLGQGYTEAAEKLRDKAQFKPIEKKMADHTELLHTISAYSERQFNPGDYTKSYNALCNWLGETVDIYQYEIHRLMWPLLVHIFLELMKKGREDCYNEAKELLEEKATLFRNKSKELTSLRNISDIEQLKRSNLAREYLEKPTEIKMSQFSHHLLFSYLEESGLLLLLSLVNERIRIAVDVRWPLSRKAIEKLPKATQDEMEIEQALNEKEFSLWGVLKKDAAMHEDALSKSFGGVQGRIAGRVMNNARDKLVAPQSITATSIPLPKTRQVDTQKKMADLKARVLLGTGGEGDGQLPSVCMYTFLNAESATSICVSRDAALCASGFMDSTVRYWNLRKTQAHHSQDSKADGQKEGDKNGGDDVTQKFSKTIIGGNELEVELQKPVKIVSDSHGNGGTRERLSGAWPVHRKLIGHLGPVFSTCISPDNQFIVSGSQDNTARLWNTETGLGLACYKGHTFPIWDVSFSPVGYYFATGSMDATAMLWSTHRGYPLRLFEGHKKDVACVRFHPNCNVLATGSDDRTLRIWDLRSGERARVFRGHGEGVRCIAIAPNGRVAASGGDDGKVFLWDLPEGRKLGEMEFVHSKPVISLDFSDDGGMLVSGSMDCSISLWDVRRQEGLATPLRRFFTKNVPVSFLRFTPRNLLIASGVFRFAGS